MRAAIFLLGLLLLAFQPARAAKFLWIDFDNLIYAVSAGTGGFLFYGPREKEDNLIEEDGIFGSEQGLFLDVDFNIFKKRGTWSSPEEEFWLDFFPYVSFSRGKILEYQEAGIKLGGVSRFPNSRGLRQFGAVGIKVGRAKIDPTTAVASDSGRELRIPEQTQTVFEGYVAGFFEISEGFGYQLSGTLKQFFVDGLRTADGQHVQAEIEIVTFATGLNFMW